MHTTPVGTLLSAVLCLHTHSTHVIPLTLLPLLPSNFQVCCLSSHLLPILAHFHGLPHILLPFATVDITKHWQFYEDLCWKGSQVVVPDNRGVKDLIFHGFHGAFNAGHQGVCKPSSIKVGLSSGQTVNCSQAFGVCWACIHAVQAPQCAIPTCRCLLSAQGTVSVFD